MGWGGTGGGWSSGGRRRRRGAGAPAPPTAIYDTDLKLWLPRNDTTVTEDGTGCSQLDSVVDGHSLLQGTDGNRPSYTPEDPDFNGKGSLTYNGTSDRLIDSAAAVATGGTYTWWIVCKSATATADPRWLAEFGTGRLGFAWSWTGTKHGIFTSSFTPFASSAPDTAAQALILVTTAGSPGTARLYEGGVDRGTVALNTTALGGALAEGSNFAGTATYFSGKIADHGIAQTNNPSNLAKLRAWISAEYGVAA